MKLYAKVVLGVVLAFMLMFVTMGVLKRYYVDPTREQMLRDASVGGLALAAAEVSTAPDREAALQHLRPSFQLALELAPREGRAASGWFWRDDAMYTFRAVDAQHVLVLGPFPDIDRASAFMGVLVIVLSLLLAAVVAYWLVAPLARRIRALASTTLRLANRDFAARSADKAKDALGDLSRRFNDMAAQIESLIETKQQLLQAVSHEFRTPLSRIRFELANLAESTSEAESARRFEAIDESLVELDDLVGELLAFVQLDGRMQLSVEKVSPAELAGEVARAIQPLRAEVAVRVDARAQTKIDAHPKYLRRALQNLVVNAIRHARSEVVIEVDDRDNALAMTVRDDGLGIPDAARERIFEPFVRLDESRSRDEGGAGLGLAIVRKICEWHGGSVVVAPADRGASFVMTLPRIEAARRFE
jgi:two-component system sensor histidine kinase RstB